MDRIDEMNDNNADEMSDKNVDDMGPAEMGEDEFRELMREQEFTDNDIDYLLTLEMNLSELYYNRILHDIDEYGLTNEEIMENYRRANVNVGGTNIKGKKTKSKRGKSKKNASKKGKSKKNASKKGKSKKRKTASNKRKTKR